MSFHLYQFIARQGQLWPIVATFMALFATVGCSSGDDGPKRYRVSGDVLYDGEPLPAGKIFFTPDTEAGNSGPGGYTDIVDGRYDTDWDNAKGVVPGPHTIRVEGFDGQSSAKNDFHPKGNMLFPVYRDEIDVPEESSEHDFDIPLNPR
ncbi:hypothetical protein [Bremerella sp. P1]|uniref:hypothetical protein n=1 Tax=Bremerella sp. P1 TaxID=3026424 RepID=UPI002368CE6B|nr:hypothetical protein [Bremerella sp. P1]WDI44490.1 hypothetical protein PSR63_11155 [Bremerella sp. P1]